MSKLRYVLVLAALYGPCSYAADPVVTNEANRKIMYGTAAVRPTPDTFDLASRGMCYVATDTGAITEWTGTAWINAATCGGGAGAVSTSPAYTTIVDSSGDSAVDAAANAVRTTAYVTENSPSGTNVDVDDAVGNIVATIDVGATASSRLTCTFKNDGDGAGGSNPTIDEVYIFLSPAGITSLTNVTEYTEADWASPSGHLLSVRTGTVSGEADATPDTTLDENDVLTVALDVAGFDNVVFEMGATADNTTVDYNCSHN